MPLDPDKIRSVLLAKGMTQADLAKRSSIAPPHISRIMAGERPDPALSTAERIAEAMGCSIKSICS